MNGTVHIIEREVDQNAQTGPVVNEVSIREDRIWLRKILLDEAHYLRKINERDCPFHHM